MPAVKPAFTTTTALPARSRLHHVRRAVPCCQASGSTSPSSPEPVPVAPTALPSTDPAPSATPRRAPRRAKTVVVRAPVMDSRVASAIEAHHWITVSAGSVRMFERAAVAHADMVRHVERDTGRGSLHRWVLRAVEDVSAEGTVVINAQARYVVMETFKPHNRRRVRGEVEDEGVMRRWLSAVERVGPALDAPLVQTLRYENLYTTKLHDVTFDVHRAVVVVESVNAESPDAVEDLLAALQETAESAVAGGGCLEFCVLQAVGRPGFFKTIEVYADKDALNDRMECGADETAVLRRELFAVRALHRTRSIFKPVVFS